MSEHEQQQMTWGRWLFEHAAGTVILCSLAAAVGGVRAWRAGESLKNIKADAATFGLLGSVAGLGFGRAAYTGVTHPFFRESAAKPAHEGVKAIVPTWTEKVTQRAPEAEVYR